MEKNTTVDKTLIENNMRGEKIVGDESEQEKKLEEKIAEEKKTVQEEKGAEERKVLEERVMEGEQAAEQAGSRSNHSHSILQPACLHHHYNYRHWNTSSSPGSR